MNEQSASNAYTPPVTPIKAVAFDMDGLMFNTEELYGFVGEEILRQRGKEFTPELLEQMIGLRTPIALQRMIDYHHLDDTVEQLTAASQTVFRQILPTRLAPMPGLLGLLDQLEANTIPKGVATSSMQEFALEVLGQFDILKRMQFVLAAEDVQEGKPNPEIYLKAASNFSVKPSEMLVLEDSAVGCKAAVAAGAYVVAVPGFHTFEHKFDGVQFVAESLADSRIQMALSLSAS